MNKLIIAVLLIGLISCKKEEIKQNTTTEVDCQCDRITEVKIFTTVGSESNNYQNTVFAMIWTANDCSNQTKYTKRDFYSTYLVPKVGQCYKMPY